MAQILAQTQGPVGFDEYSYGIRSRDGAIVHCGRSLPYAKAFGAGTVIGISIRIPPLDEAPDTTIRLEEEWPPLKLGQYQVRQEPSQTGIVSFSVDGEDFGVAFKNTQKAKYYPAVSMFGGASVTLNLGPNFFKCPPKDHLPVCDLTKY